MSELEKLLAYFGEKTWMDLGKYVELSENARKEHLALRDELASKHSELEKCDVVISLARFIVNNKENFVDKNFHTRDLAGYYLDKLEQALKELP